MCGNAPICNAGRLDCRERIPATFAAKSFDLAFSKKIKTKLKALASWELVHCNPHST